MVIIIISTKANTMFFFVARHVGGEDSVYYVFGGSQRLQARDRVDHQGTKHEIN